MIQLYKEIIEEKIRDMILLFSSIEAENISHKKNGKGKNTQKVS